MGPLSWRGWHQSQLTSDYENILLPCEKVENVQEVWGSDFRVDRASAGSPSAKTQECALCFLHLVETTTSRQESWVPRSLKAQEQVLPGAGWPGRLWNRRFWPEEDWVFPLRCPGAHGSFQDEANPLPFPVPTSHPPPTPLPTCDPSQSPRHLMGTCPWSPPGKGQSFLTSSTWMLAGHLLGGSTPGTRETLPGRAEQSLAVQPASPQRRNPKH